MKHIASRIFFFIAAVGLVFPADPAEGSISGVVSDSGQWVIAEIHDGALVQVVSDKEIKQLLEDALTATGELELQAWLEKVWFEKHGESYYLRTVAENTEGEKLSSAIKLQEVRITANASAVGIPVPIVIPYCKSISCTNDPCPMNIWPDHIECYCIAAGECELKVRIIFVNPTPTSGF